MSGSNGKQATEKCTLRSGSYSESNLRSLRPRPKPDVHRIIRYVIRNLLRMSKALMPQGVKLLRSLSLVSTRRVAGASQSRNTPFCCALLTINTVGILATRNTCAGLHNFRIPSYLSTKILEIFVDKYPISLISKYFMGRSKNKRPALLAG